MKHYRCYFTCHPVFVTTGSRVVVEQYHRLGDWSPEAKHWFADYLTPDASPQLFSVAQLTNTHVLVREVEAERLEAAFSAMQIERWSHREYEAFARIIEEHDLTQTTMCAGDVIEDVDAGTWYECERFGWREMQ